MLAEAKPGVWAGWRLDAERWALLGLGRLQVRLGRTPKKARHLATGERGEMEAMFFLRRLGYLCVEARWRSPEMHGDVDLIGWEGETLCFVEVKTRTKRDFAPAAAAVDGQKQRMLRRMARAYRRTLPRGERQTVAVRYDVVSVYLVGGGVECELVRGAFPVVEEQLSYFS